MDNFVDILCITTVCLCTNRPFGTPFLDRSVHLFSTVRYTFPKILDHLVHLSIVIFDVSSKEKVRIYKGLLICQNSLLHLLFPATTERYTFHCCILVQESSNTKGLRAFLHFDRLVHLSTKRYTFPDFFHLASSQESRFYAVWRLRSNGTPLALLYYTNIL